MCGEEKRRRASRARRSATVNERIACERYLRRPTKFGIGSGPFGGAGVLRADGRAVLPVVDSHQQPISESAAWGHDWRISALSIGADTGESAQTRERIRDFARSRLASPADDAFLAEILAAESDY